MEYLNTDLILAKADKKIQGMGFRGKALKRLFLLLMVPAVLAGCGRTPGGLSLEAKNTYAITPGEPRDSILLKAAHVVPTENQYDALKNEFIAFVHFGPNTFTRMEWGNGMEDPRVFELRELDTDQWCEAMKDAGMKMVILTVKHHDGFVLWQSRYTRHGIMSTDFQGGKGDILRDLSKSCQKYGLKLGVYLSPADLYQIEHPEGLYGNLSPYKERTIPREVAGRPFANGKRFTFQVDDYNEYFLNQLFELLTEYGPIHEVWFDGAHPKRKGNQQYNYLAWKELITALAPKAVIFGKQDIRWCGNEAGGTRDTEWNVIPYSQDPHGMKSFADLTEGDLGSREKLYGANYLHYQPAETNTSIREGWFYRDETRQKVRSADDVFDIYERSVGGNSIFLLNIPPDRQGRFSNRDVAVLEEVGRRIGETYGTDLFEDARGPEQVLDHDPGTFVLLAEGEGIEIRTEVPMTINRLVLQEAIATHGERVEEHLLEAWVDGDWQSLARATNIGHKRILRFPPVTSDRFRLNITASRAIPALANISAHYYRPRPPQLRLGRNANGSVYIEPLQYDFDWKPHGEDAASNLSGDLEIYYSTDGSEPNASSQPYTGPFEMESGTLKAVAFQGNQKGSTAERRLGIPKGSWNVLGGDSDVPDHPTNLAVDGNPDTHWISRETGARHHLELDLGKSFELTAFSYTPPLDFSNGMIEKGRILIGDDGMNWKVLEEFEFGNLINDPTPRTHYFDGPVKTRFLRIESSSIAGGHQQAAIAEIDFHGK